MNSKGECTERECDKSIARDEDLSTSFTIVMQVFKTNKELEAYKPQISIFYLLHLILLGLSHFTQLIDNVIFEFSKLLFLCVTGEQQ